MTIIVLLWEMLGRRIRKKRREIYWAMAILQEADGIVTQAEEGAKAIGDGLAECREKIEGWLS